MSPDVLINKDKFDSILKKLIQGKPTTQKEAVSTPKLKKDGTPKKKRFVRKMDK